MEVEISATVTIHNNIDDPEEMTDKEVEKFAREKLDKVVDKEADVEFIQVIDKESGAIILEP